MHKTTLLYAGNLRSIIAQTLGKSYKFVAANCLWCKIRRLKTMQMGPEEDRDWFDVGRSMARL